ncbi:hypothetical protein P692DRAFT_201881342, partial [Suillus brevipes Sb2]
MGWVGNLRQRVIRWWRDSLDVPVLLMMRRDKWGAREESACLQKIDLTFSLLLGVLYILTLTVLGDISQRATLASNLTSNGTGTSYFMNVTDYPGYTLGSLQESDTGLTAGLTLAGLRLVLQPLMIPIVLVHRLQHLRHLYSKILVYCHSADWYKESCFMDKSLRSGLHPALSDRSHHPPPDKSRIDIILDSDVLALKGTAVDIEPALLSGHVVLTLTEATSIKEINLQFRGKTRVPPPPHELIHLNSSGQTYSLCTYDWSFLEGEK